MAGNLSILTALLLAFPLVCWSIPVYRTRGTYYEVGKDVGEHFREVIQEYYSMMTDLHNKLLPFVNTTHGSRLYEGYLTMSETHFPQYVDELRGIAEGSRIPFKQVFINHIWGELSTLVGIRHYKSCTDVYFNVQGDGGVVEHGIGHNEDGDPKAKTRAYILQVTVINNNTGKVEEDFTAFAYPGSLPGDAYGFNSDGLVLTMNAEHPVKVETGAVPHQIILRATYAAKSQIELENLMLCHGTGVGYGYNLNYGNSTQIGDDRDRLVSYEVVPDNQSAAEVSKLTVGTERSERPDPDADITAPYYHFNMYNHTAVKEIQSDLTSSYHRQARVNQLALDPASPSDAATILGDTHDQLYPIYRTPRPTEDVATLTTAMFDLRRCVMLVYTDNPKTSEPSLSMPLPPGPDCRK